jgi:transcriptional regulator with XRE-family HTH domain
MQEAQKKLGNRIRKLREEENLSQEAFADACGLNRVHMSDIERGEVNLTLATLNKIAQTLHTTSSALLKGIL